MEEVAGVKARLGSDSSARLKCLDAVLRAVAARRVCNRRWWFGQLAVRAQAECFSGLQ